MTAGSVLTVRPPPGPAGNALRRALRAALSWRNPRRDVLRALGRPGWRRLPEDVVAVWPAGPGASGGDVCCPRGAVGQVRAAARAAGVGLEWESRVTWDPRAPPRAERVALRPYQDAAARALLARVQGVVVLPCGGGKTTLGAAAVARSGQRALVLVHTRELRDQWVDALRRVAGLGTPDAAVGMVQRLADGGPEADALLQSAGVVVVDECHHAPSATLQAVLHRCPARYRWGLTATPDRADDLGFLLPVLVGPVVYERSASDLAEAGYLVRPVVVRVSTGWRPTAAHYEWDATCPACGRTWTCDRAAPGRCRRDPDVEPTVARGLFAATGALSAVAADPTRADLVARLAAAAHHGGRRTLVLVPRRAAGPDLVARLRARGVAAREVSGSSGARHRRLAVGDLRAGRLTVLVATQLADEGLDVPELDCVVNAATGRAAGRALQRAGRLMRPAGRPPVLVDLVDGGPFESQWAARRAAYVGALGARVVTLDADAACARLAGDPAPPAGPAPPPAPPDGGLPFRPAPDTTGARAT